MSQKTENAELPADLFDELVTEGKITANASLLTVDGLGINQKWEFTHQRLAEFRFKDGKLQQCIIMCEIDNSLPLIMRQNQKKFWREWKNIESVPAETPDREEL